MVITMCVSSENIGVVSNAVKIIEGKHHNHQNPASTQRKSTVQ
jgi:hypothetical protein